MSLGTDWTLAQKKKTVKTHYNENMWVWFVTKNSKLI